MTAVDYDIILIGAGLAGIGAACRLKIERPDTRFLVLEGRGAIGGTWDQFRYPGSRCDTDIYTYTYPFHPWMGRKCSFADRDSILEYIQEASTKFGVDPHIRLRHRVVNASWSSKEACWTLEVEAGEEREPKQYRCRFLLLCCGYYNYETPYTPSFRGSDQFQGQIVHPQWWPQDLDYTDKRIVVIGSGATAFSLVPTLAKRAAHVTMVQRSPAYVLSMPTEMRMITALRSKLPPLMGHRIARGFFILLTLGTYTAAQYFPRRVKQLCFKHMADQLPDGVPLWPHFSPVYRLFDQRPCFAPNAELFTAIADGKISMVTDTPDTFTERGVRVSSGQELDADIIVTATGFHLQFMGRIRIEVDGQALQPRELVMYKGVLAAGVPNFGSVIGSAVFSWTTYTDLAMRYLCRLFRFMDRHGYDVAMPHSDPGMRRQPLARIQSGYIVRGLNKMPTQGNSGPWDYFEYYPIDAIKALYRRVDDRYMSFSRKSIDA